jgi:hypothetical protein
MEHCHIEQDIPCGNLAIEDFEELINSLLKLKSGAGKATENQCVC